MPNKYTVNTVRPTTRVDAQGNLQEYYEIWFTTESGQSSYVRVIQSLDKNSIRKQVDEAASKIDALMQPGG